MGLHVNPVADMTVYFPFQPSTVSAPTFNPTFDDDTYQVVVTWNIFGQRYYVECYDLSGNRIFSVPRVESPGGLALDTITWDVNTQRVTATTNLPHNIPVGSISDIVISDCSPSALNGPVSAYIKNPTTFQYSLAVDPGEITVVGSANFLISMTKGFFSTTMVYRNNQFEVG